MTTAVSPRLRQYAVLGSLLLLGAVAAGRVELVAAGTPLLLLVGVGLATSRRPQLGLSARLRRARALEGETIPLDLEVTASPRPAELEVEVPLPPELRRDDSEPDLLRPRRDATALELKLQPVRWGGSRLTGARIVAHDRLGLHSWQVDLPLDLALRVYPAAETVGRLLQPARTNPAAGAIPSRARGEGLEFADIRPYEFGDQVRRINWRATARRSELMINRQHPERSSDVVLLVDSFTDVGNAEASTLGTAVRVAAALARAHLARRDRVGVIGFGGVLRWLLPGSGSAQAYRVLDALIDSRVNVSYAWRGLHSVPPRTLPPSAQVVAMSPLGDERTVAALLDLAGRGRDLAVVEIPPAAFLAPSADEVERAARRIYELRRVVLRDRFLTVGVPVATWRAGRSVEAMMAELLEFRRTVRLRRGA